MIGRLDSASGFFERRPENNSIINFKREEETKAFNQTTSTMFLCRLRSPIFLLLLGASLKPTNAQFGLANNHRYHGLQIRGNSGGNEDNGGTELSNDNEVSPKDNNNEKQTSFGVGSTINIDEDKTDDNSKEEYLMSDGTSCGTTFTYDCSGNLSSSLGYRLGSKFAVWLKIDNNYQQLLQSVDTAVQNISKTSPIELQKTLEKHMTKFATNMQSHEWMLSALHFMGYEDLDQKDFSEFEDEVSRFMQEVVKDQNVMQTLVETIKTGAEFYNGMTKLFKQLGEIVE